MRAGDTTIVTSGKSESARAREQIVMVGRVQILYALSQQYLFLPFAALCMAAALLHQQTTVSIASLPLILQCVASVVASRLKAAYEQEGTESDPKVWAHRHVLMSALTGGIWGLGAVVWFVPGSFPAQAYLTLAFLGMSATEFVSRAGYRPSYMAHAIASLGPLALALFYEGTLYSMMASILVLFFGGVLYTYSETVARLLDESILLRHDNGLLVQRLSQEKAGAETARDSAQASERAKSAFISSISHEIRTPLNAILGMAQLLERSDLEKAQRDHVKVLLEAGRGLRTLLDDIITLAQQQEDVLMPLEEGCDASQAVRTVARLLQPNAWEKRLRLAVNIASGLPRAAADPRQLRRVLLKLAGNAIKFTDRGSIEIAIDVQTDTTGHRMLRFCVTDTGPGIPAEVAATLFEPFARGDNAHNRRHNGAGVGLAVSRRLIENMGGTIGVDSEPGMGASFWFTMPVSQNETQEVADEDHVTPPGGLFILAYAPDEAQKDQIRSLLSPFGNRVTFAPTLAETTALASRGGFALILAEASGLDALVATPGLRTPIVGLMTQPGRPPRGVDVSIRWPGPGSALYRAIAEVLGESKDTARADAAASDALDAAIDAKAFAELEKSLGFKTLIDILQSYLATAEELANALNHALEAEDWTQAGKLAQDIAGAAGGLGLSALTSAARALAQGARDGKADNLSEATQTVLSQHSRVREALRRLYPDLAA